MKEKDQLEVIRKLYLGVLLDSLKNYEVEGVLDKIESRKKLFNQVTSKRQLDLLKIDSYEQVFTRLSEILQCSNWEIEKKDNGFIAVTSFCFLCTLAKSSNAVSPCNIFCLDPIENLLKVMNENIHINIIETLWKNNECRVEVIF